MELLKFFLKDEVPAVGLAKFKQKETNAYSYVPQSSLKFKRIELKPDYSNNFFLR